MSGFGTTPVLMFLTGAARAPLPPPRLGRLASAPAMSATLLAAMLVAAPIPSLVCATALASSSVVLERRIDDISDVPAEARLALFTAQQAREQGDPDTAVNTLLAFLEGNPEDEHFLLHFHLAVGWNQRGDLEEALRSYRRSVELEPLFAQGWLNLGELAYNMGLYAEAADALMKGYGVSEWKEPNVLFFSSAALVMDGRPAEAVPILERLVTGSDSTAKLEWHRALIMAHLELEDAENGTASVERMLSQYPDDPEAWRLAFRYYASSGLYEDAAVSLTVAGYLRSLTRSERMTLGDLYLAIGVPIQAGDYYESAVADSGSVADLERMASAHLSAYEYEQAFEVLNRALSLEPTARLWSLLGDLHFMQKDYQESYNSYSRCVEMDPQYERAYLMMGYCAMQLQQTENALAALSRAAEFPEQASKANQLIAAVRYYAGH
ncbi:MAG: tetratricopeptide repeat protein [Candidatus Eisenbacteria bacterium]|nr:tetratricopeptide repeat protein [Candidatus Eisenbacteria bacterium]